MVVVKIEGVVVVVVVDVDNDVDDDEGSLENEFVERVVSRE